MTQATFSGTGSGGGGVPLPLKPLGEILTQKGLVSPADVDAALRRQREQGGHLGDHLIAMGALSAEQMERALHERPAAPRTIAETGIGQTTLLNLLVKAIYGGALETPSKLQAELKLPNAVISRLIQDGIDRKLLENLGPGDGGPYAEMRYALTELGLKRANEALGQNMYVGPAPVSLAAYQDRIVRQRITNERVGQAVIDQSFAHLIVPEEFVRRLGPGINSGRSILLYGPPGNGKTSVAEKIGLMFRDTIYIPHAVEVEGQIIKVFDGSIHQLADPPPAASADPALRGIRRDEHDHRWVACKRPIVITGGELTLEMLDLSFNELARFYEAPLHVKALGGTFIIDDFGRQLVSPEALLNRWIVPLQSRVDYLKLHTGKSFQIPFDELVIFSTNMAPADLMDPAFLRRIPYKLETAAPSEDDFRRIFLKVASDAGLTTTDEVLDFVIDSIRNGSKASLAAYQPKFIVDQVLSACKYEGIAPAFSLEKVADALRNLYARRPEDAVTRVNTAR